MEYKNIQTGIFLSRPNRFVAYVETAGQVEKVHVNTVSRVKAQTVDPEFVDPHAHRAKQMAHNVRIAQVELDQIVMPLPAFVPERIAGRGIAAKVQVMEPAAIFRLLLVFLNILEGPEFPAYMVKNPV